MIETEVQIEMKEESLDEILDDVTETFTESEKKTLLDIIVESAVKARDKAMKYFHADCYPSRDFIKSTEFFHPTRSLRYPEKINFKIRNFPNIPDSEFKLYRQLARVSASLLIIKSMMFKKT